MEETETPSSKNKYFINRLKKELPFWISQGWITPDREKDILASLQEKESQDPHEVKTSTMIFSLLGMILLTVGILLFIAAHWEGLAKVVKLSLLFGGLWGSYASAYYFITHKDNNPYFGYLAQLFLLLGVVVFGANIWLIAQIYHISSHFPNGVLIWALGAWLVGFSLQSQASIVVSLLLTYVWSYTESQYFLQFIHWPFLVMFFLNAGVILREKWSGAFHVLMWVLMIWLTTNLEWLSDYDRAVIVQHHIPYISACILGSVSVLLLSLGWQNKRKNQNQDNNISNISNVSDKDTSKKEALHRILQGYAVFFMMLNIFYLTTPEIVKQLGHSEIAFLPLIVVFLLLAGASYAMFFKYYGSTDSIEFAGFHGFNIKTVGTCIFTLLGMILLLLNSPYTLSFSMTAAQFNVIFLGIILWIIALGHTIKNSLFVNIAFFYFAIFVIARYFDMFWELLDRSLFFMIGGIILLAGSFFLEKKRRQLTAELRASSVNQRKRSI